MNKKVNKYSEVKDKILRAVDTITDPIRQTMSPKGRNVIYENAVGKYFVTNDGVTIAKEINVADPIENSIIEVIKGSALKTNTEAGDGTSTTILLSSILIKDGLRLLDEGWNGMDVVREYENFAKELKSKLKKEVRKIKDDNDLLFVSKISANNDDEIAKNVVRIIKTAGLDGQVILDRGYTVETEIIEDTGFVILGGMLSPELTNVSSGFFASYTDVPVLVTDKRLYYAQEAETILKTCLENGYREVVIVAQDFIGEALPFFVANHKKGTIKVLLVKDPDAKEGHSLEDLATYLGGEVVSDKKGSIVDNLTIENFMISKRVISDNQKTVIMRDKEEANPGLTMRVSALKKELKKFGDEESKEHKTIKKRISSLTNGMVTLKVGGRTDLEIREKLFRYEDAISAARVAMMDGYLVGGGISIFNAYKKCKFKPELARVFKKYAEANIRQIAENCGLHPDTVVETIYNSDDENIGYNALSGRYEDLLEAGVLDPYKVTEMAIDNSVSIANVIISSGYLIVNDNSEENVKSEKQIIK